nr:RNA-directed DNA polymerase, eukaryota, reverse transcriptase zinc-binding domain protein [Tanacetum cinerariifolium]
MKISNSVFVTNFPDHFSARDLWNVCNAYGKVIDKDVVKAVEEFFVSSKFPPGSNSSFITLIPKTQDAKMVKDFRPISLIGSTYKIITKIMANRLSMVISDLVSDVQSAFVFIRQILDGPFILNELLSWCKFKKTKAMIFKVDFEKAFDSVRWDFLDDILDKSKAFSITFTILVITTFLEHLFVNLRLSHESTSSFKELLEVSYCHGVLFVFTTGS